MNLIFFTGIVPLTKRGYVFDFFVGGFQIPRYYASMCEEWLVWPGELLVLRTSMTNDARAELNAS